MTKRSPKYTHSTKRVYLNVTTAVLSIIMAITLLGEPLSLGYYVVSTSLVAMIVFALKIRLANMNLAESQESPSSDQESTPRKRVIALFFLTVLAIIASPFLLARFLPPTIWFIVIVSLASGISISELIFFIYCKKMVS